MNQLAAMCRYWLKGSLISLHSDFTHQKHIHLNFSHSPRWIRLVADNVHSYTVILIIWGIVSVL